MQQAYIITNNSDLVKLNQKFDEGWYVVKTCPMPSSVAIDGTSASREIKYPPTCLVIIAKVKLP